MAALTGVEAARAMQAKFDRIQSEQAAMPYAVEAHGAFRVFADLAAAEAFAARIGSTVVPNA